MVKKSEWSGVACETEGNKSAVKSWFNGLADKCEGPIKADILTRIEDDRALKIRALFINEQGKPVEMVRTMGVNFSISMAAPTKQRWVGHALSTTPHPKED